MPGVSGQMVCQLALGSADEISFDTADGWVAVPFLKRGDDVSGRPKPRSGWSYAGNRDIRN